MKKNTSGKSIIFLQETHSTQNIENLWRYQWHGDMIFSHRISGCRGVCVAFQYDQEYKTLSPQIVDKEERFIILHIKIQGSPYSILNYYDPNDESSQLNILRLLAEKLRTVKAEDNCQFILVGDWNLIFDKSLDSM